MAKEIWSQLISVEEEAAKIVQEAKRNAAEMLASTRQELLADREKQLTAAKIEAEEKLRASLTQAEQEKAALLKQVEEETAVLKEKAEAKTAAVIEFIKERIGR